MVYIWKDSPTPPRVAGQMRDFRGRGRNKKARQVLLEEST